ncbi:MAG: hypothetical protein QW331_02605 [Candidatus Woesearchaeota archaeon]
MEDLIRRVESGEKIDLGDWVNDDAQEALNVSLTLSNNDVESVAYLVAISRFYGNMQKRALETLNDYLATGRLTPGKCKTLYKDHRMKTRYTIQTLEDQLINDFMEPIKKVFVSAISQRERYTTRIHGGRMAGVQIAHQD